MLSRMRPEEQIPHLNAYLERMNGLIGWMLRPRWDELGATTSGFMPVNLDVTPMRRLADSSLFLAAVAFAHSEVSGQINVYRMDPKDRPLSINEDRYFADLALGNRTQLPVWIIEASTSLNPDLSGFLGENVPLFKMEPDPDHHWLLVVPASVWAAWDSRVRSTIGTRLIGAP